MQGERTRNARAEPGQSMDLLPVNEWLAVFARSANQFQQLLSCDITFMTNESFDWKPHLDCVASSDIGLKRKNNQDSHGVRLAHDMDDWRERGHLFVVADGMGAHAAGELASQLAVEQVSHLYRKHRELSPPEAVHKAISEANDEINRRGQANLSYHRMGTTCSSLLLLPQGAVVAHIGDSRIYLCRAGCLRQMTFDHSLVWEMREAGITDEQNKNIPKNVITRSLGPEAKIKIDLEGPFPLQVGDTYLLCSDGLTGLVLDEELAPALSYLAPEVASQLLTNLAILRGGHDNITMIIVRVVSPEQTSQGARAAPLVIGESSEPNAPVHPALWVVFGLLMLASVTLFALGPKVYAASFLAAAAVTGLAILAKVTGIFREGGVSLSSGRKLGKGPYTETAAQTEAQFMTHLHAFFREASATAQAKNWELDFPALDGGLAQAEAELSADRYADAFEHLLNASDILADACRLRAKQAASAKP